MPYWSYQAAQKGAYILEGEKQGAFTKKTYRISGNVDLELDGFGHDASRSFADRISEDLAPFDPNGHRPFAPGYLSGFYADVGDVNAHDYDQLARREITEDTARLMAKQAVIPRRFIAVGIPQIENQTSVCCFVGLPRRAKPSSQ